MPLASKIDLGIVFFDLSAPNKTELLNGLLKFATFKWFSNSRSLYKVFLVNSSITKNSGNFPKIYEIKIKDFNPKVLVKIIQRRTPEEGANWLDALKLGIIHLEAACKTNKGIITLQLIFFTSLKFSNVPTDEAEIESIIENLNSNNIYLYFIGPDVQLPYPITNKSSVVKCMEELDVDPSDKNLVLAHRIVTNSGGVICNTNIGAPHLLTTYKNFPGVIPQKAPLTFGTNLSIPVSTYRIYRKDLILKLHDNRHRRYVKTMADDPEVVVRHSNLIKGLNIHGKFLKIDNSQFKMETQRCFDVVGFTDKINVPETYMCSEDTFYILPETTANNFNIFTYLVEILHEEEKYGIVKRVYGSSNNPRYFALIANVNFEPKCLIMTGLKSIDFILPHKFEIPSKLIKPEEDDFQRFFNSLIIENRDNRAGINLGPTMMMDIQQQKLINATAKKYIKRKNFVLESLNVCDFESVPNNNFLEDLRANWPIRTTDTTS